jgi:SAM-dependent methyltransferase
MSFNDHFSGQSRQYAAFRPAYPRALAAFLAGVSPGRELAWDAATGQGQAARILATEFRHVLATDASAAQIASAEPCDRVGFRVGDAGASGLAHHVCDLVTAAQAAHWFDLDRFYAEVRRVLRPRGVIAIWGYVLLQTRDARIDRLLEAFQNVGVGSYWPAGREILEAKYQTLPFPFETVAAPPFFTRARWTRDDLLGYVSSWSAVARCRQQTGADPMPAFAEAIARAWPRERVIDIQWPLYLLVGRVGG